MKIPYMPVYFQQPIPSLRGSQMRYRPVLAVRLEGPNDKLLRDSLLDTGADDTVFEEWVAVTIGVDLTQAEEREVSLVGRPQPVRCKYAAVQLRITDGIQEAYEWTAIVGFVAVPLRYGLLGHAGFLEYFEVEFRGDRQEATLKANPQFPGRYLQHKISPP